MNKLNDFITLWVNKESTSSWAVSVVQSVQRLGYGLDNPQFESQGARNVSLLQRCPDEICVPPNDLFIGYWGPSLELKRLGCEVDCSLPSNTEVKNEWSCTSTFTCAFMVWTGKTTFLWRLNHGSIVFARGCQRNSLNSVECKPFNFSLEADRNLPNLLHNVTSLRNHWFFCPRCRYHLYQWHVIWWVHLCRRKCHCHSFRLT